jgi:hypothetical protein
MNQLLNEFIRRVVSEAPTDKLSPSDQAKKSGFKSIGAGYWSKTGQPPAQATTRDGFRLLTPDEQQRAEKELATQPPEQPPEQSPQTAVPSGTQAQQVPVKRSPMQSPVGAVVRKTVEDIDLKKIFGFMDNVQAAKARVRNLMMLKALTQSDKLDAGSRSTAQKLYDDFTELLSLYTEYKTTRNRALMPDIAELAHNLQEKHKFFSNESGTSFKTLSFGIGYRHIFGNGSALSKNMVEIFNLVGIDLRKTQRGDKQLKNALFSASLPDMGQDVAGFDRVVGRGKNQRVIPGAPNVASIFKSLPFIPPEYHSLFGPTQGEPADIILNPNGKNAKLYFEHSVNNSTSLDATAKKLRENGMDGMADAIDRHKQRMVEVLKNFDNMKPANRKKAVQDSYAQMAVELHKRPTGDPELCSSIMKNIAEINLYDQEIANGEEVYLPSHRSFPAADKLVRRKAGTKGERVSGISVKYGKSGKVYGMPAQSSTITLFHPDSFYHGITSGRPGIAGYELGVRADSLAKGNWRTLMQGSGHSKLFNRQEAEELRVLCEGAAKFIATKRGDRPSNIRIREVFGEAEQSKYAKRIHKLLFGDGSKERMDRLTSILGTERVALLRNNPLAYASVLAIDSAIVTSGGFANLEHCHQQIVADKEQVTFDQAVEPGSNKLECWHYTWRATDERGGGLIMGYNCAQ